jgi:hypothetical protein
MHRIKRIEAHKGFFERAWKMQVKRTALNVLLMEKARREMPRSEGVSSAPRHRAALNRYRPD